jgi:hypothetical protein
VQEVEEVGGSVKALSPVVSQKESLERHGVHDIIGGMNHSLSLTVLWRRVGTLHPKLDTMRKEEGASGGVAKLMSIVSLKTLDGTTKLRGHISEKVRECGERVILMAQWKGPRVMSTIIQNNQIVLISRNTRYRRSPKIAMDQIKSMYNPRPRNRKR